jgi:hypothetical protein
MGEERGVVRVSLCVSGLVGGGGDGGGGAEEKEEGEEEEGVVVVKVWMGVCVYVCVCVLGIWRLLM